MKKFIIIIIFVFLIALLISFNYLLWDREKQMQSFQDLSDSKNLTIETLSEKMNNLDKLNKELNNTVTSLSREKESLQESKLNLTNDNTALKKEMTQKSELIQILKKSMDSTAINTVIKRWVEALNAKNYAEARQLISTNSSNATFNTIESIKENYEGEIKSISLKSAQIYTAASDDEHLLKIQFKTILEVTKPEGSEEKVFKAGENEKYFTMDYDVKSGAWLILDISDKP